MGFIMIYKIEKSDHSVAAFSKVSIRLERLA